MTEYSSSTLTLDNLTEHGIRLIGIDTETTGTVIGHDRICQVACIEVLGLGTPDFHYRTVMTEYCDPGIDMPEGAFKVHGIGPEKYKGTTLDKGRLALLAGTLEQMGGPDNVILFGHNAFGFDIQLMHNIYPQGRFREYHLIDTMKLAFHFLGCDAYKRGKLAADDEMLAEGRQGLIQWYVGEEAENAHDAEADCAMTAAVLEKMLVNEDTPFGQDLLAMAEFCDEPRPFKKMPFGKYAGKKVDPKFGRGSVPKGYFMYFRNRVPDMSPDLEATVNWALGAPE